MHRRLRHARRTRPPARTHARTHARTACAQPCRWRARPMQILVQQEVGRGVLDAARRAGGVAVGTPACGCASDVLCCFALNEMSTAGDALPVALTQWGGLQRHVPFADRMGPCDRTRREMPLVRKSTDPMQQTCRDATNSMREHPPSNVQEAPTPWFRRGGAAASNATRTCTCAMHRNARVRPTE